jgi:hypothetical protein
MLYPTIIQSLAIVQLEDARRRAEHTQLVRQVRAQTRHARENRKTRPGLHGTSERTTVPAPRPASSGS